ncbi:hypothetical protein TD95_002422, partial [Thielaviopsis punctulata]
IKARTPKSVVFSGKAHYQDAPVWGVENARPSSSLPPSRTLRAPKGILKASPVPIRIDLNAGGDVNLAEMLDSAIKQLSGTDKTSRVEAYSTLSRALKASNNLPDRMALNERLGTILKFLQRDITTPPSKDPTDHSLVINSLMMLLTLLFFSSISNTIPADFGIFIVDHCIKSFEDQKVPKEVVRSLMQVIFTQNFPLRVMTSERLRRLILALHNIEQHVASSKILIFRARIYKRLLKQCRSHLITHPEWMPDLFTDMLSTIKDVRYAAIDLGFEAAITLGAEIEVSTRVIRFMSTPSAEGSKTYLDFYIEKLSQQFKKPAATDATTSATAPTDDKKIQDLVAVPKIWTILLLFIRSRPLERWDPLSKWLNLIPPCFNSTDIQCRLEANIAWSRFMYVIHLHQTMLNRLLSGAIIPALIQQLSRRQFGRKSEADFRRFVLGGICSVFYYTYSANIPVRLYDRLWDTTYPLLQSMTSAESHLESRTCAISIITNLLDTSNRRPWDEEYVLGPEPFPSADLIPCLDSRWINRNLSKIQKLVKPLIERNVMNLAIRQSSISRLYNSLSTTVCVFSAKEIKVSSETIEYLTYFVETMVGLWNNGVPGVDDEVDLQSTETFMESIKNYVMSAVDGLGLMPFMETVPAKISTSSDVTIRKCVEHMVLLLTTPPSGMGDCVAYEDLLSSVFMPFFADKPAVLMAKLLHAKITSISALSVTPSVWKLTANAFIPTLSTSAPSYANIYQPNSDIPLGKVYKDVVKVLEIGLKGPYDLNWDDWDSLYTALCEHTHALCGAAGEAMAVNEPLAKAILAQLAQPDKIPSLGLLMVALIIVRKATYPFDKTALETSHFKLWGVSRDKTAGHDPFNALYAMQNHLLKETYQRFDDYNKENFIEALFHDIDGFLERCSAPCIVRAISLLQPGFSVWLRDAEGRLDGSLFELAKGFFTHVCALLAREPASSISLETFEPLLTAGFQSKHGELTNLFATMWNRLFQDAIEVQYPESLKELLLGLQPNLELILPGLHESAEPPLLNFRETQAQEPAVSTVHSPVSAVAKLNSRPTSRQSIKSPTDFAPLGRTTRSQRNSGSTTPVIAPPENRARSRHDNSQVDFVVIEPIEDEGHKSQVFTEHQKEVRERQRQESHFHPSLLRTTSDESQMAADQNQTEMPTEPSTPPKAETPKTSRSFDGYLEASPTPRRSTAPTILDQDLSDVPSSPLQSENVRRYPLIPDMHKRASAQMREDWPEFSSPVNSSPVQPLRLTRSQKRAAETSSQQLADTLMTDVDSQQATVPEEACLNESLALEEPVIKQEKPDYEALSVRSTEKQTPKRLRKSLSDLPPLHMKTRSSMRSRALPKLSGAFLPVEASTQEIDTDAQKESESQETQDSDVPASQKDAGSTPSATRTQKRRRQNSVADTPLQSQSLFRERLMRHRKSTPTLTTRRSKRTSTDASAQPAENNIDSESEPPSILSTPSTPLRTRAATPSIASAGQTPSAKRKRRRSTSLSASRKKKRNGKSARGAPASGSRESSQGTDSQDTLVPEDLEPGAEVSIDTDAIMAITETAEIHEDLVKKEPGIMSSPLSDLSNEPVPEVGAQRGQRQAVVALPSDEEVESQVLAELAASISGEDAVVLDTREFFSPPTETENGGQAGKAMDANEATARTVPTASVHDDASLDKPVDAIEQTQESMQRDSPAPASETQRDTYMAEPPIDPGHYSQDDTEAKEMSAAALISMLRNGVKSLRVMSLSREQMYEIEDVCMDFKRELYDAEKRGRS